MGLLDNIDSPEMGFAMGLLQAGGPSRAPVGMGQGLMMGLRSAQEAKQAQQVQAFKQMQMDQFKQQQEEALRKREAIAGFRSQLPPNMQQLFDVAPDQVLGQLFQKPEAYTLKPGERRFQGGQEVAAVPAEEPKMPSGVQEYQFAVSQGYKGTFADFELQKRKAGATNVGINTPYEPQFNKEIAGLDAKALDGYRTKSEAAKSMLSTLTRLEQLSPSTYTGGGAGAKLAVANFLQGMGVNIDPSKVANSQEFDAIASRSVLDSLGGSLGAGTSNADVAFIQKTVPQLSHSVEARKQMIEFMRNKAMKQIKTYDSARSHAEKNAGLKGWKAEKEVVRTGTYGGKKVVEYDDGSVEYAD